jgi:hypothetical protein
MAHVLNAARIVLGLAACGWAFLAGLLVAYTIEFGGDNDRRVAALFAATAATGVAGAIGLFFRGPWGALLVVAQALGWFLFWLIPGGQASASLLVPGGPIATMLLGLAVAWQMRTRVD